MRMKPKLIDNVSGDEITPGTEVTSAKNGETYLFEAIVDLTAGTYVRVRGKSPGTEDAHLVFPEALDTRIEV